MTMFIYTFLTDMTGSPPHVDTPDQGFPWFPFVIRDEYRNHSSARAPLRPRCRQF